LGCSHRFIGGTTAFLQAWEVSGAPREVWSRFLTLRFVVRLLFQKQETPPRGLFCSVYGYPGAFVPPLYIHSPSPVTTWASDLELATGG